MKKINSKIIALFIALFICQNIHAVPPPIIQERDDVVYTIEQIQIKKIWNGRLTPPSDMEKESPDIQKIHLMLMTENRTIRYLDIEDLWDKEVFGKYFKLGDKIKIHYSCDDEGKDRESVFFRDLEKVF